MASGQLNSLLRQLRRVVLPRASDGLTDAQLLERFLQSRDEAAFELLVWRHGAMVLNVCRRVLSREHDAEDAFQAAFLTLARKADTIGKRTAVGSWLYKVAYRIALRARAVPPPQALPQEPLRDAAAAEPLARLLNGEMRSVLDEEVERLPEMYRAAFVLCHLEGQTLEAAALTLGCPQGTVGTRVARAREMLRRRLRRRGFALSALLVSGNVVAALPAALVDSTNKAALLGTANQAAAAGVISARVAALTKGALQTMSLTKLILAMSIVLVVSLLGGAAAFLTHQAHAVEPGLEPPNQAALCAPAPENQGVLLKWKFVKDRPFYQVTTTETVQKMKVMGNDVNQTQKQTFYLRWTPLKQTGDVWELQQKIEGVAMDIDVGNQRILYDSTAKGAANNPLTEFFKALVGTEFTVTLDTRTMRVAKVSGREDFLKKLSDANPQMRALLENILSENALKEMAESGFAAIPQKRVSVGENWQRAHPLDMGPLGKWENHFTYTYAGREGKNDKIKVAAELKFQGPGNGAGAPLPFKISKSDLKHVESGGVLFFDRDNGCVALLELIQRLDGTLAIDIGGQVTEVKLAQTQKITVKTTDTNPLK